MTASKSYEKPQRPWSLAADPSTSAGHFFFYTYNPASHGKSRSTPTLLKSAPTSAQYAYGPFGEVLRSTGPVAKVNPFRFSTKYQDDETDLLYYGYRYYDASTGRWLSRDPIAERGGVGLYCIAANDLIDGIDLLGLKCCGAFAVMEVKGIEVEENQQASANGAERVDGFKVLYWPCDDCSCRMDRIKLVQAMKQPNFSPAFDARREDSPYIGRDGVVVLPEYLGWKGPEPHSFLDGPFNRHVPKGLFESEVCAVCRDGQKVLGCVKFTFNLGTRKLSVPGGKKLWADDLARYGNPGKHGDQVGNTGFIKGCADPGELWSSATKAWEGRLPR